MQRYNTPRVNCVRFCDMLVQNYAQACILRILSITTYTEQRIALYTASTVEPLFQARDFIFAYDNLCIRILNKDYLNLAVEPV